MCGSAGTSASPISASHRGDRRRRRPPESGAASASHRLRSLRHGSILPRGTEMARGQHVRHGRSWDDLLALSKRLGAFLRLCRETPSRPSRLALQAGGGRARTCFRDRFPRSGREPGSIRSVPSLTRIRLLVAAATVLCLGVACGGTRASTEAPSPPANSGVDCPVGHPDLEPPTLIPSPAPDLPAGIPPSYEEDVPSADVPSAALSLPERTSRARGTERHRMGEAIVVAWLVPGSDPLPAGPRPRGMAAVRRRRRAVAPGRRPDLGEALGGPRRGCPPGRRHGRRIGRRAGPGPDGRERRAAASTRCSTSPPVRSLRSGRLRYDDRARQPSRALRAGSGLPSRRPSLLPERLPGDRAHVRRGEPLDRRVGDRVSDRLSPRALEQPVAAGRPRCRLPRLPSGP